MSVFKIDWIETKITYSPASSAHICLCLPTWSGGSMAWCCQRQAEGRVHGAWVHRMYMKSSKKLRWAETEGWRQGEWTW